MHSTPKNSVRCFWLSVSLIPVPSRWYEPLGESLSRLTVDSKTTSEFTVFNLVIRLSKVNCWPCFSFHPVESCVELLPAVPGNHLCVWTSRDGSLKLRQQPPFSILLERLLSSAFHTHDQVRFQDMSAGVVIFSFYGRWWGSIVHVIQGLNTDSCL